MNNRNEASRPDPTASAESPALLAHHRLLLDGSAISGDIAAERGYWSATEAKQLDRLFGPAQRKLVPALVIPTWDPRGERVFSQLRPDSPRVVKGKANKYELPGGTRMAIDVPPRVQPALGNPQVPLIITEGARKADAAVAAGLNAIDLVGVWTWRGRNKDGGLTALADWEYVALNNRVIYLVFDSDALTKAAVHGALERLTAFLNRRDADVRIVYLPSAEDGAKIGLDDFLAAGHTRDDVLALASDQLRPIGGNLPRAARSKPDAPLCRTDELLDAVCGLLERFVVLPGRTATLTIALFVLHTWAFDAAHATPYLTLQSAVKRSGKTRLEEMLELLVRSPWRIVAASESAMFRKIHAERPTLLLDEVDALFGGRKEGTEPIRAILNAGNRPGGAVARNVGEGSNMTVADFEVFCPKVLAGISTARWPDTVIDRSIVIRLRRKKLSENVEQLRPRKLQSEVQALRARLERWGIEHVSALREADPRWPDGIDDRGGEAWEPLLAIAELADQGGGDWAQRARHAALTLAKGREVVDDEHGVIALKAIRRLFADADSLLTTTITAALNSDEELPFGAYRNGAGLDGRSLANLMKAFEIRSRSVRVGAATGKGYRREQFADAWERYCPAGSASTDQIARFDGSHRSQPRPDGGSRGPADGSQSGGVTPPRTLDSSRGCRGVTHVTPVTNGSGPSQRDDAPLTLTESAAGADDLDDEFIREVLRRRVEGSMKLNRGLLVAIAEAVRQAGGDMADVNDLADAWNRVLADRHGQVDRLRYDAATASCACSDGGVHAGSDRCGRCFGRMTVGSEPGPGAGGATDG